MQPVAAREQRLDRMARLYDDEILPIWSERFAKLLLKSVTIPSDGTVLEVGCTTGHTVLKMLEKMNENGRVVGLDSGSPLLDVARQKVGDLLNRRVFLRTEPPTATLGFADAVFDLVVANTTLLERDDPQTALREFSRVTKPGGQVAITLPLAGTYREFYDVYKEVLTTKSLDSVLVRLEEHLDHQPQADDVMRWMRSASLERPEVEIEEFRLLFKSGREFFFAPVIEYGPLDGWKHLVGKGQRMQEVFWQIKEAIDTYFAEQPFEVTVQAACFYATRPEGLRFVDVDDEPTQEFSVMRDSATFAPGHSAARSEDNSSSRTPREPSSRLPPLDDLTAETEEQLTLEHESENTQKGG